MKSYIYNKVVVRLIMGLLPFYLSAFLPSEAGARKHKQLVILHTNDTHSTILPVNPNIDNKDLAGRGGFLRRVNVVKEQRELHPELLLIDSGDFSQGSGYYTIGLMNMMGYDAATIGNHEFDFGLDNMAKLFRQAQFPIVCSNYDCTGTVLEDLVKPYATLVRNGVKIGLFALAPPLKGLVFDGNCEGITYLDPACAVRRSATSSSASPTSAGRSPNIPTSGSSVLPRAATSCWADIPTPICRRSNTRPTRTGS